MKRYNIYFNDYEVREEPDGDWTPAQPAALLAEAVRRLVTAKGRYHTQQSYEVLCEALKKFDEASQ